jgi:hypothetical protein
VRKILPVIFERFPAFMPGITHGKDTMCPTIKKTLPIVATTG